MNVNGRRGEVAAELDGRSYRLCLTLGALAELEAAYGADDLGALVERFGSGRLSARDLIRITAAGLRGGGNDVSDDEVAAMQAEGGPVGFAGIVARLLKATFGAVAEGDPTRPYTPQQAVGRSSPGARRWPGGSVCCGFHRATSGR